MGVIGKVATDRADEMEVRLFDVFGPKLVLMLVGELDEFGEEDKGAADGPDVTVRGAKGAGFVEPSATLCPYE